MFDAKSSEAILGIEFPYKNELLVIKNNGFELYKLEFLNGMLTCHKKKFIPIPINWYIYHVSV